jgi:hypothetical protein
VERSSRFTIVSRHRLSVSLHQERFNRFTHFTRFTKWGVPVKREIMKRSPRVEVATRLGLATPPILL